MSHELNERYTLGRQIGIGGGGIVYEGRRLFELGESGQLGRDCAIKLIHASRSGDSHALQQFVDEADRGYQLTAHPNLIATRDFGKAPDGRLYLVMDLAGQTLEELEDELHSDLSMVRAVADAVLSALDHLHAHGVVHGDLCAGNIYLCEDGVIKLGDLGRSTCFPSASHPLSEESDPRPAHDLRRFGLLLGRLLGGTPKRGQQGGRSWLPAGTPAELLTCVSRALHAQHETGENALTARELRTLLRETRTHIARPSSVAGWLAAHGASTDDDAVSDTRVVRAPTPPLLSAALPELLLEALQPRAVAAQEPDASEKLAPPPPARSPFPVRGALLVALVSSLATSVVTVYLTRAVAPNTATGVDPIVTAEPARVAADTATDTAIASEARPSPASERTETRAPDKRETRIAEALVPATRRSPKRPASNELLARPPRSNSVRDMRPRVVHRSRLPPTTDDTSSGTRRQVPFDVGGENTADINASADFGEWVDDHTLDVVCYVDNSSDSPYRLTHVQMLDEKRLPVPTEVIGITRPMYREQGTIGVIPANHVGTLWLRVPEASTLTGRPVSIVFSERGGARPVIVGTLRW